MVVVGWVNSRGFIMIPVARAWAPVMGARGRLITSLSRPAHAARGPRPVPLDVTNYHPVPTVTLRTRTNTLLA